MSTNGTAEGAEMNQQRVPTVQQREEFAAAVEALASATYKVLGLWQDYYEDDAYTPDTGYPYTASLDEIADAVASWADAVASDADIAAGRA
jgi:hypothetical protein